MKALRWILLGVLVLIGVLIGTIAWLLNTQSGAEWAAARATSALYGKLAIGNLQGTLSGPLTLANVRYSDPASGLHVQIDRATVNISLGALLSRQVHVQSASTQGVLVQLSEPTQPRPEQPREGPLSLEPPIDVVVDQFTLNTARIERDGERVFTIRSAEAAGHWTDSGLLVRTLEVDSPDASIVLQAKGTAQSIALEGQIAINGERYFIEPLRVTLREQTVSIEELTVYDAARKGTVRIAGTLQLDREPFHADLTASWKNVVLPEERVGQELHTNGELAFQGSPEQFAAKADLALGPPDQMGDIRLAVNGSTERIEVEHLTIAHETGRLSAKGTVGLQPAVTWSMAVQGESFNPGTLVAGWPGNLDFSLDTQGELQEAGPSASLQLEQLQGELRERKVSGSGDLTLQPDKTVAGTLEVRSGESVVRVSGERGEGTNAVATFDVASLNDWVPDAQGRLNGRIRATGEWPQLTIAGTVNGRNIVVAEASVGSLSLEAEIVNPREPSGSATVRAADVEAAGFEFASIDLRASGDQARHTARLTAEGERLNARVRIQGQRQEDGWSGTIEELMLAAPDITRVELAQPARLTVSGSAFSVSQSCLRGEQVSVCLAGERNAEGGLQASYVLENLPLPFIASVAAPDLPVRMEGTLQGRGEIRREPDGALFGDASITSDAGSFAQPEEDGAVLLSYDDLQIEAELAGENARLSADAALGGGGQLDGTVSLTDLRGTAPIIQGEVRASIADLSPVELFVTQVVNLKGRGELQARVDGTLQAPEIIGEARLVELATEIPRLGLQLREGTIVAARSVSGEIRVSGGVTSGDGRLEISGGTSGEKALELRITGKNVLAADIPGARVVISPELDFRRTEARMDLEGTVRVPNAKVNLDELPQGGGGGHTRSSDVVVVDAQEPEEEEPLPLHVNVRIVLGEDVTLTGFGLDAGVDGALTVRESPGEEPTGSGIIQVEGTYKAYGQDLTITEGRLLFAGTPLDNPQLNITAIRELTDVTTQLNVTGTAQNPQLSVSSDPTLSQTEALSYLVTGKPLNDLGSGEGDLVQSAARSLGGAAGNLLAKGLGKRLGIDEIGIEQSAGLGGASAFTIGEYLSPRLYLSYGVGLFEPGEVVTLRYRISDKVSLEASQGPEQQRAGINYRIER